MLRGIELMFTSLMFDEDLFVYLVQTRTLEDTMELVERKLVQITGSKQQVAGASPQEPSCSLSSSISTSILAIISPQLIWHVICFWIQAIFRVISSA